MKLIMESWRAFSHEEHATDAENENILYKVLGGPTGQELVGLTTPEGEYLNFGTMLNALLGAGYPVSGNVDGIRDVERRRGPIERWNPVWIKNHGFNIEQIAHQYAAWMGATLQAASNEDPRPDLSKQH